MASIRLCNKCPGRDSTMYLDCLHGNQERRAREEERRRQYAEAERRRLERERREEEERLRAEAEETERRKQVQSADLTPIWAYANPG